VNQPSEVGNQISVTVSDSKNLYYTSLNFVPSL